MRKILILNIFLLFSLSSITFANVENKKKEIIMSINKVSFEKAIKDVCRKKYRICKVLKDKNINSYLKKHYKKSLYSIALIESSFKYKYGKKNKNDRGYFQINTAIWNPEKIKKLFGIKTTYWSLTHNIETQTKIALRIWLYNSAVYIIQKRKFPKNIYQYAALYHSSSYISKNYSRKIKKVIYKTKL